jgi:hypothetical protein
MNPFYVRYQKGIDSLGDRPWQRPKSFQDVTDLLGIPFSLLQTVARRLLPGERIRELSLHEARRVWEYIVFDCRRGRAAAPELKAAPRRRMSLPKAMERLASIQSWPCSHRILADALHVSRMMPGRYANGADLSTGITREAAEAIVREYCR